MPDSMYEKIKAILGEASNIRLAVVMLDYSMHPPGTPYVSPEANQIAALVTDDATLTSAHEALMRLMRERIAAAERNN